MFSFLKRRSAEQAMCKRIGVELHRQIMLGFDRNESRTSINLAGPYTAGFVIAFIRTAFANYSETDGQELSAKYQRKICNGVLPKRLNEIVLKQTTAYELAADIPDRGSARRSGALVPSAHRALFERGLSEGCQNAFAFSSGNNPKLELLASFLTHEQD